jgi:hypothetical protein
MRRPSRRWWINIAAVNFALLSIFPTAAFAATDQTASAQTAGTSAGETIKGKFGSQDPLRLNILNPMSSSETPLETVDGSTSFSAQLSFPSSKKFLEIFMQPGSTGDLGTVIVGEDLNFDGTTDYSFQVPFPVSGVCANGLIACTPGTWLDCSFFRWTADAEGRLSLPQASLFDLGSCYCINNDCGNNLVWQNLPVVLQDLGGGAVGAVQRARPDFSVSRVELGGTTITYYGQDTSRQTDPDTGATLPPQQQTQTAYFQNPFSMAGDASAAVDGQTGDPDSLYSSISTLSDLSSSGGQEATCSINRVLQVTQAIGFCQDPIDGEILADIRERRFYKVRVSDGSYVRRGSMPPDDDIQNILDASPPYASVILKDYACNLNHARSVFDSKTTVPAEVRSGMVGTITSSPSPPTDGVFLGRTIDYAKYDNDDSGCRHDDIVFFVYEWYEVCTRTADVANEEIQNGCEGIESDPDCSLKSEKVDGMWTYRMFNPTGLVPLPSTRTFPGVASHDITRNWWQKQRVYLCAAAGYDFADTKTRFGQVVGSLNDSGSSASYQDMLRDQGDEWAYSSGNLSLPDLMPSSECEKACKTRRPRADTQATLPGHTGQLRTSTDSYDILYHTCVNDECPADPGEEILKNCQCLNEFAEAATIMQMLRLAGQDTICSDGVAKTPSPR